MCSDVLSSQRWPSWMHIYTSTFIQGRESMIHSATRWQHFFSRYERMHALWVVCHSWLLSQLLPVMLPSYYLVWSPPKKRQLDTFHFPGTRTSPGILLPPLLLNMDTFLEWAQFPFCLGDNTETSFLHTPGARPTHSSSLMTFPTSRWSLQPQQDI